MNMHFLFPAAKSKPILLGIKQQTLVYYFTRAHKTDTGLRAVGTDVGAWWSMLQGKNVWKKKQTVMT